MDRIEAEKNRSPIVSGIVDPVRLAEKSPVTPHGESREHPFQYRCRTNLPVSRHTDELYSQSIEKRLGSLKLRYESPVGYVTGQNYEVRCLRDNVLSQGTKSPGVGRVAKMKVRKVHESHCGEHKRSKEQSQPVRHREKVP